MTDLSLQSHLHTVRDFIRWSASRMTAEGVYFGHGTSNAIDENQTLVYAQAARHDPVASRPKTGTAASITSR